MNSGGDPPMSAADRNEIHCRLWKFKISGTP